MTRWTAPPGGGYSGKGEPRTPPGPPPKNPGSATPQAMSEAYVHWSRQLYEAQTALNEVGRLVTVATETGDDSRLLDDLVAVLDRYVRGCDLPPWRATT